MKLIKKYVYEAERDCGIIGHYELVGEKEKNGCFGNYFQNYITNDKMGEKTFEKGERKMLESVCSGALKNAGLNSNEISVYLGGDLMNQLISSNFVAEFLQIPFIGIYSACATLTRKALLIF